MKIIYQTLDGRTASRLFDSTTDFVRSQNLEIPALDDSFKVLSVEVGGRPQDFTGSVFDLYNFYNQ